MNNKKTWTIIGIIIFIALIIIVAVLTSQKAKTPGTSPVGGNTNVTDTTGDKSADMKTEVKDVFREEVPTDIKIPEVGEKLTEAEAKITAVPTVVTAAAPGVSAQFRSFNIKAENNVFTPSKIIGRVGDTIHVNFTAVDKSYDIIFPSYNMKQTAKQGETKILEFQAVQNGSYTYYCEMCGGPDSSTKGNIIIAE